MRNKPEVKPLAAGKDSHRDLIGIGSGEDKFYMGRRLLERLKKSVKGVGSYLMDFVDDVDLKAPVSRGELYILAQLAYLIDAPVGSSVYLYDIKRTSLPDLLTACTDKTGPSRRLVGL